MRALGEAFRSLQAPGLERVDVEVAQLVSS